ncbi:MAG: UvrD-helicase domain-containing protein [Phenylobacterium sp.]|uniref:UvrD-helicase domain-containing protein n=1 Tax=Phenylobacterium sp. TaxID=1871053 RepID=UPI001A5839B5|nr:UvrD-helicase domain-containing protein [Phenylobacterium sp.]MBL8772179.1 UvrD-helicase domain-containing protein [Phenylobacterium sp.]
MTLVDADARRRALTELDATLLVEAAAGTGKTSLMAGRAAMLLASGVLPERLAAITFTELAAGQLAQRIREMVGELVAGETPTVLAPALRDGLSPEQKANLARAAASLDDLTTTTIHGFCQGLIQAYAVEADLDPGAQVMDAIQADAMFDGVFTRWLTARLSAEATDDDPVGVLAQDDPLGVVDTLRELAALRRRHATARPPAVDLARRPDLDFVQAVDDFARWFTGAPPEPRTAALLDEIETLCGFYTDSLRGSPSFADLWRLSRPPHQPGLMKAKSLEWKAFALQGAWRRVAGADGPAWYSEALSHLDVCREAFARLLGQLGGAMVCTLSEALDEALEAYAREKRAAAALDFDDLQARARDLLRGHDDIRCAVGRRYAHIFVDEFQDTDPEQAEIIFAIASTELARPWTSSPIRPGALFLVGDPKQAIYRFRGAHVGAYNAVRDAFAASVAGSVIQITANFRSVPDILSHVNRCFAAPLEAAGQPGYVPLATTQAETPDAPPCAVRLSLELPPDAKAGEQRDTEALAVAETCRRLVGALEVRRTDGSRTPLRPGDIALLAPTGTELWRYERALEAVRLSVASQAGKTLMLRQETQDLLALARTLADATDTLAFGALMRGPLVGLTEADLLEITHALPPREDGEAAAFTVATDPRHVSHAVAHEVLGTLRDLRRRARSATPAALLGEAVERLRVRVALTLRAGDRSARALANLDALLQRARGYGVRGLQAFVADLQDDWAGRRGVAEGRVDESDDAIAIVTIHSAKGLEWPVVIPINTSTQFRGPDRFVHRQVDDTLHWIVGGVAPPALADAQAEEEQNAARERERLWYVACTRARDLLILPHMPNAGGRSWSRVVDLGQDRLPELDLATLPIPRASPAGSAANDQTADVFAAEAAAIAVANPPVTWRAPSSHDPDRAPIVEPAAAIGEDVVEQPLPVGAGRIRGLILHKLMEELLNAELDGDRSWIARRAAELGGQLAGLEGIAAEALPDPAECAEAVLNTLALPEIAGLRPHLVAEATIWSQDEQGILVSGRIDALALEAGDVTAVLDWKSDLAPTPQDRAAYVAQLTAYLEATSAPRGALVYMSRGEITWVERPASR